MSVEKPAMRLPPIDWWEIPEVCPGCGCTEADACLVNAGPLGERAQVGCRWVFVDEEAGWRCNACVWPEDRERGPVVDHRAVSAGPGVDA